MKRLLSLSLVMLMTLVALGQTQQGYVKTKGRMVDGKLVHGQGLKGATISVHGRTSILVKGDDGAFSFMVTEPQFRLDSVRKKGYRLVDMDALGKTYSPSPNPIYLVMETPEQQLQDQLDAERKIRRALTNQLHQREDEIEALKKMQKITDEEYRKALQKLYEDTGQNDQLVNDMVERYSKIDYDLLSEFDQKISELILNGELAKADSMLRTKGDINERVSQYKKHEAINAKEREELSQRQEQLEQSEALAIQERDDLANDCYRKFEIFKMQHENDSAAYYLELRAGLDTTNVEWLNEAAIFIQDYSANYSKSMELFFVALNRSRLLYGDISKLSANCYTNIGIAYSLQGDDFHALDYQNTALKILQSLPDRNISDIALCYNNIGSSYGDLGEYEKAMENLFIANELLLTELDIDSLDLALTFNNIGLTYYDYGQYGLSVEYLMKALDIDKRLFGDNHPSVAEDYNNLATVYWANGNYTDALELYLNALNIVELYFTENHPMQSTLYNNLGTIYSKQGEHERALSYIKKALSINQNIHGEYHPIIALNYSNLGNEYRCLKDYDKAFSCENKALSIRQVSLRPNHPDFANSHYNLNNLYYEQGLFDSAMFHCRKALEITLSNYGENNPSVARDYYQIGLIYFAQDSVDKAITNVEKAIEICYDVYNDAHPSTALYESNLAVLYSKKCQYETALEHFNIALRIYTELFGEEYSASEIIRQKISEIEAILKEQENPSNE